MKNKVILSFVALVIVAITSVVAQSKKGYVQGTLQGADQKLTGYFLFDHSLANGAQRIYYKDTQGAKAKELNATPFQRFESTEGYLEKFNVPHASATQGADFFLERIEKGKINLYKYRYVLANQKHSLNRENFFYVQKGLVKTRVSYNNFKSKMEELVSDHPELLAKIRSNTLSYYKLQQIVVEYNRHPGHAGGDDVSSGGE